MNIQSNTPATPLRHRMIEDMRARNLGRHSQRGHLASCARLAAFLARSPDTATADDIRRFQLWLIETGASIAHRNRIMTGIKFLARVTLRRHDLVSEIFHLREPQKIPLVLSRDEVGRLLAMAPSLKVRAMLSLAYGCGLRAGEVVRLRVGDIDGAQNISVTFRVKDYRIDGPGRYKTMTLETHEFIRRFLMHVLPRGQHRIRHYGLLGNGNRAANIARVRELLAAPAPTPDTETADAADQPRVLALPCPCCGGRLVIVETFAPGGPPEHQPVPETIDSS